MSAFTVFHENIIELFCNVNREDIELPYLIRSIQLCSGGLAFPTPEVRRKANIRRQNINRRVNPITRVFVATDFYPFFAQNDYIDKLLASQFPTSTRSTMSRARGRGRRARDVDSVRANDDDDDDDITAEDDLLTAGLRNLNVGARTTTTTRSPTRQSITPPRGKKTRATTKGGDDEDDPLLASSLALDFTPTPNPFNIQLFNGGRMWDDDGAHLVSSLFLSLPFLVEEDIKNGRTSLALDMECGLEPDGIGSSALYLTCPVVSYSFIRAMPVHVETTFDIEIKAYHDGNNVGVTDAKIDTACQVTIDNCNAAYASIIDDKSKEAQLATYRLKLPRNPSTGKQIYVHSNYWQGEDWNSRYDRANADLRGGLSLVPIPQNSRELTTDKYEVMMGALNYRMAICGTEELDLIRMTSTKVSPKKPIDRMQAARMAQAAQDMANTGNRSSTTTHKNTSTTRKHNNPFTTPRTRQYQNNPTTFTQTRKNQNYTSTNTQQNQYPYSKTQDQNGEDNDPFSQTNTQQNQYDSYSQMPAGYEGEEEDPFHHHHSYSRTQNGNGDDDDGVNVVPEEMSTSTENQKSGGLKDDGSYDFDFAGGIGGRNGDGSKRGLNDFGFGGFGKKSFAG